VRAFAMTEVGIACLLKNSHPPRGETNLPSGFHLLARHEWPFPVPGPRRSPRPPHTERRTEPTPSRPRRSSDLRNSRQNASDSIWPTSRPITSHRPVSWTASAITTARPSRPATRCDSVTLVVARGEPLSADLDRVTLPAPLRSRRPSAHPRAPSVSLSSMNRTCVSVAPMFSPECSCAASHATRPAGS